jgi:hypothetical protein
MVVKQYLILREAYKLRAFENRMLRKIFRPETKKKEEKGGWRKLFMP